MKSMNSTVERTSEEDITKILVEQAPVGVCIMQDGKFCYVNSYFSIATGYTADELMGKDSSVLIVPEDRELSKDYTIKMLKGEVLSPYQFRVICKDGSIIWVMETVKSIQYHGRQAILGNYMEITGRKQIEDALKDSEERYRELADSVTDVFFAMDEHLRYTYWNKASEVLTGIRTGDALGKSIREIFPDKPWRRRAEKVYRDVLRTQQSQIFVNDYHIDGRHYVFEISAYPSRGGISVFVREITERKQAEEELQESKERFQNLAEGTSDWMWEVDTDGVYTYANPKIKDLLGYEPEEVIGKTPFDLMPLDEAKSIAEKFRDIVESQRPFSGLENANLHKDGRLVVMETSGVPFFNADRQFCGYRGIDRDITGRKRVEEKLQHSEEKYRALFDSAVIGTIVIDAETMKIMMANQAAAEMLGLSNKEELIGVDALSTFPLEEKENIRELMAKELFEHDLRQTREFRMITKDGREIWISANAARTIHEGRLAGLASFTDITERKQAVEALRQSEERYRTILEEMEDAYFEVDLSGHFTFVNNSVCRNLGYSSEELMGMSYKGFTVEEDIESVFLIFNEVYQSGVPNKGFPWRTIRKDGSHRFAETSVSTLRNDKDEIIGFRGIGRDITEHRRVEEALQQSEENYRALFDSSVIGTVVIDAETMKSMMANQAAAEMFGFSSVEELIGADALNNVPPEDKESISELMAKNLFEQDLQRTHEFRMITQDGREIWISANTARIIHNGKLACLACFTDITEQKQQNERLMMADRLASIGELAAGAAHELNNPLTSIIGFSQLLMEKEVPDDIREDLKIIDNEAQRAAIVTNNLLSFARKHSPMKQPNQINNIIEDVLELRAHEHKVNHIDVERHLAPNLPEILVDYFQMQQLFMNIIINAEYFVTKTHNGGTLTITTQKENSTMRISIADDGPGIPPEDLGRIFDPFFTTKEAGSGTGLGLSICHGIVNEHSGQIYVRSQLGKGATIFIELPIKGRAHIKSLL